MYNYNKSDKSQKIKLAIALGYDEKKDNAPRVITKGKGEIAKKIIEIAEQNKIPLYDDKSLAETLSLLEINHYIPIDLYATIAEIFNFIEQQKQKIKNQKLKKV